MGATSWRAIKDLLASAENLAPAERPSFLAAHFPDPLQRQAIEALINDNSTQSVSGDNPAGFPTDDLDLPAGTRIGPYLIVERLGIGGMGEVFLGNDTRLRRKVALKCLRAPVEDATLRERILHEARAAARINHPHVATVHDIVEHEGRAFIVMEYVEGESLARRIARGPFPLASALAVGRQLASALAAAHARGVVHRDLKPANIQIRPDGSVKVLDFGVAQVMAMLSTSFSAEVSTTAASTRVAGETPTMPRRGGGTPAYMAPEQLFGGLVDERSDVFSLGTVLYEMTTGRRPFQGPGNLALLAAIQEKPPRAESVNAALPSAFGRILERALEFDRDARFQSAEEFDQALAAVSSRDEKGVRPRTWIIAGLAAAVVLIAAVSLRNIWLPGPPAAPSVQSIAILPLVNLSGDPKQDYLADAITDGLINTLGRISALKVTARTSVTPFKRTTKSIAEIARALGVDAVVEGSAVTILDPAGAGRVRVVVNLIDPVSQTQLWNGTIDRPMIDVLALENEIARLLAESIKVAVTPSERARLTRGGRVNSEALRLYLLGRDEWNGRTAQHLNDAVRYFRQATEADSNYAPAYAGLADSYALLGADFGMPRETASDAAIANASKALALDPNLGEAYASMGFVNRVLNWNWPLAGDQLRQALALNPSYATAHQWYGNLLSDLGREDEALAQMRRALELDPLSPIISRDVAWPLFFARRYDEAAAQLTATLAKYPGFLSAERLLARTVAQKRDFKDAVRRFEAISLRDKSARAACELAWAYALDGRRADAERTLDTARTSGSRVYPYDLALVFTALGRTADALDSLERAYLERDATLLNLKHDPRLDALRTDPRFTALLDKMRFPR